MRLAALALALFAVAGCTRTRPTPPSSAAVDPAPPAAARPTPESIKRDVEGAQQRHDDAIDKAFDNAGK